MRLLLTAIIIGGSIGTAAVLAIVGWMVWSYADQQPSPPQALLSDSAASAPAQGIEPTALPELSSTLDAGLPVGTTARVAGTDAVGLAARLQPSTTAAMLAVLPDGNMVEIMDGPRTAEGERWYLVRYGSQGDTGWVHGEFLTPNSTLARSGPTATVTSQSIRPAASGPTLAVPATAPSARPAQPSVSLGQAQRDQSGSNLFDPCATVRASLEVYKFEHGENPAALGIISRPLLRDYPWPLLVPVLHRIALNPSLAGSPSDIAALVTAQVDAAMSNDRVFYSYQGGLQALNDIEGTIQSGNPSDPGVALLTSLWSNPDRRAAWRAAALQNRGGYPTC
jgi:hypothetical protein